LISHMKKGMLQSKDKAVGYQNKLREVKEGEG
jgi:hypothetical protein